MKTITVVGDNLFRIAAVELADATQWVRIAELNSLSDPIIISMISLLIPDVNPNAGGGIAPQ
jgi:hypothetical protein